MLHKQGAQQHRPWTLFPLKIVSFVSLALRHAVYQFARVCKSALFYIKSCICVIVQHQEVVHRNEFHFACDREHT